MAWPVLCKAFYMTLFPPYITAGIGVRRIDVEDFEAAGYWIGDGDDTVFTYGFVISLAYTINKKHDQI